LDVSMPLSTQEWGDVRNEFAEWIESNPEFQDDSPNSLFEVKNERGERVFHVDTSPEDDLGNDVAEAEFPHSQFGAGHISNMKQAVRWLATLGVKPQDFTAAQWTRRNHGELEKVVELDVDELQGRVEDLEDSVVDVESDVGSLESQVTRLEGKIDGVSEGVQQNREWINDVEERVDDSVKRLDAGRKEFHEFRESAEEDIKVNKEEIESVEKWFADRVSDTEELVHNKVGSVEEDIEDLDESIDEKFSELQDQNNKQLEAVKELTGVLVDGQVESRRQRERMEQELELIRRRQERSLWSKARSSVKSAVESVRSVVGGFLW
jgi:archaellum component FlaC